MGEVYRPSTRSWGRKAAVKLLWPRSRSTRRRSSASSTEAARDHADPPPGSWTSSTSATPRRSAYIVMELLEGESLAARLGRVGALPVGEACRSRVRSRRRWRRRTPRDRPPRPQTDNVFVVPDPERPAPSASMLDFGNRQAERDRPPGHGADHSGSMMGTPLTWLRAVARRGKVDHRADVYSLGLCDLRDVCGRLPSPRRRSATGGGAHDPAAGGAEPPRQGPAAQAERADPAHAREGFRRAVRPACRSSRASWPRLWASPRPRP